MGLFARRGSARPRAVPRNAGGEALLLGKCWEAARLLLRPCGLLNFVLAGDSIARLAFC